MTKVITITIQKGGMGKSTVSVNVAIGLAQLGYKTLFIDLDQQASGTKGLGIDLYELGRNKMTIGEVLSDESVSLKDTIIETRQDKLHVCPGHPSVDKTVEKIIFRFQREQMLKKELKKITGEYEYVVIDCSPKVDVLSLNALVVSDMVISPTDLEGDSGDGIKELIRTLKMVNSEGREGKEPVNHKILLNRIVGEFDYPEILHAVSEIENDETGTKERELKASKGKKRRKRLIASLRFLYPIRERILKTIIPNIGEISDSWIIRDEEEDILTPVMMQQDSPVSRKYFRSLTKEISELL
jgi:cellulose biosynthesis protein BcsQ